MFLKWSSGEILSDFTKRENQGFSQILFSGDTWIPSEKSIMTWQLKSVKNRGFRLGRRW
tara:strand:- start:186 stop:362 length:177 start_codon:yes stop_codon:yes gene_type:complete